jgi:proteasome beta subunit
MSILHDYSGSSFLSLLKRHYPELLPKLEIAPGVSPSLVHGTTICSLTFSEGVVIGGDRRATMDGHVIMSDEVTKVFKMDDYSAIAIAGTFGPSVKMAKLFQVELEHYEKIEGVPLSLDGKANRLSQLIEQNFPAAMQGLVVMPLYAGYDLDRGKGRIFEFDVTGGTFFRSRKEPYAATGSGGDRAAATFEHFYRQNMTREEAVDLVKKALSFAARKDTATGGQKSVLMVMTRDGLQELVDDRE